MGAWPCDPSDHLQESPGPKSQKSLKTSLFGGPQKSPRKYPKKSKITQNWTFCGIFDFFEYFRGLFCGPPKRLVLRLFCDFGPGDSCKWSLGSQGQAQSWAGVLPRVLGVGQASCRSSQGDATRAVGLQVPRKAVSSGRKHPSRDVIFSGQNLAKKCQKLSLYMTSSNL